MFKQSFLRDICNVDGVTYYLNVYLDKVTGKDSSGKEVDSFYLSAVKTELHENVCQVAVECGMVTRNLSYKIMEV